MKMNVETKLCVLSGGTHLRYPSAYRNQAVYSREHGYDYRFEISIWEGGVSDHYDIKLHELRRHLTRYDWMLWVDDDTYFTDFRHDHLGSLIREADEQGKSIVLAAGAPEPRPWMSSFINTGVILIKNTATSFRFIDAVLKHDLNEVRTWWDEQQHGLFTGGDQDKAIMTLLHDGYIDDTLIVTHERLNSRDHLYSRSAHDAFICHFCGHYDRKLSIAHFAKRYHLSPDLLPPSIARKYGLTVATMSPLETALRQRRRNVRGRLKPFLKPVRDKIRNSGLL